MGITIEGGNVTIEGGSLSMSNDTDPIITDGLQFRLDAGNSASYPGTGTDWFDLSGNGNDGVLTNGPTYSSNDGGYFDFDDASSEYVDIGATTGLTSIGKATFVAWVYRDGSQSGYAGIIFSRLGEGGGPPNIAHGMNIVGSGGGQLGYHWNSDHFTWTGGPSIADSAWSMVAVSVDGGGSSTDATAYVFDSTGVSSGTNSGNHVAITFDDLDVGRDEVGTRFWDGRIAQALIYDRALTQAELTTNFNASAYRYGLSTI
jgi:hypothetical protein